MTTLQQLHHDYEQILHTLMPGVAQDKALSALMDRIKAEFGVPLMRDPTWERNHKAVIALYLKVSKSRTTV